MATRGGSQISQTPRGRAIAAQTAAPAVNNGIAMIGGVPYVLSNSAAVGVDNRDADMNRFAQEFQTRVGSNLSGQARSNALGVPSLGAPRTGQWVPVSSLTPEFYTRNYEQNWKNAPGYTPVLTPELRAALATGDPNKIATAHYNALHSLPDKGQDFGSFLADFAPQIALGAIPGVGPALAATYGGVRTAVNGGSPLEILLNAAGSYTGGQLIPGIQSAGGIQNFINQGISKATGIFSNPSSAFTGATSGAASNPFQTAVDVAGNVPSSLISGGQKKTTPAPTPTAPSRPSQSSPNFMGPRTPTPVRPAPVSTPARPAAPASTPARPAATPMFGQLGGVQPVRRAMGGPIDPRRDAMNPMGGAPAAHYGLASLEKGGAASDAPVEGYLDGPGDGMSDSIKATIDGKQPARLADGEFVIPADVVSGLGNGSSKAGAKVLYAMMDRIRKARTGTAKQGKEINAEKFLPA